MKLHQLRKNWERFGETDPYWAIITDPTKKDQGWNVDEFYRLGQHEIDGNLAYLRKNNIDFHPGHALDFGCGAGRLTQGLAKHFAEVTGVDIALSMIELAKAHNPYPKRVRFVHNDQPHLQQFADQSVDFIYSNITLQHIPPPASRAYLREFVRLLKPQGLLVFQLTADIRTRLPDGRLSLPGLLAKTAYRFGLTSVYRRLKYWKQPVMDMHFVPRQQVVRLLEAAGATILDVRPDQSAGPLLESFRYVARKI